jgi:NAD-dependent DNA ligase
MYFYSRDGVFLNGVGPSMLETLLQDKIIFEALKRSRWALLEPDTYNITEDIRRVLSPGIFESYMDSLMAVDSELDPARFIGALGYKTLGRKRALVLLQLLKGYKIQHTKHAREALLNMPYAMQDLLRAKKEFQYFCFKSVSPPPEVTYCVTGELSYPREEIIRMLEAYRWQYSATVNKSLTYLVVGELDHETTKLKMAKRFKITLIGEDDLPLGQKGEPDDTTEESNAES